MMGTCQGFALKPTTRRCLLDLQQRARPFAIYPLVGPLRGAGRDLATSVWAPLSGPTKLMVPRATALGGDPRGGGPWWGFRGEAPALPDTRTIEVSVA